MFVQRNFLDSSVQTVVQKSSLLVPLHPSGAFLGIKTNGEGDWVTTKTYRYQISNVPTSMPQTITDYGDSGQNGIPLVKIEKAKGAPKVVTYWQKTCYNLSGSWEKLGFFMDKGCEYGGTTTLVFYVPDYRVQTS